ncbi:MAG: hypothetical protein ACRDD7_11280 [Peptostreptococcaceae bacterium]
MNKNEVAANKKYVSNIIEVIKDFKWQVLNVWVDNNCIYGEVKKQNGKIEEEGLYAGSDFDPKNVYEVYSILKYTLNFNGMLNDDNIMI